MQRITSYTILTMLFCLGACVEQPHHPRLAPSKQALSSPPKKGTQSHDAVAKIQRWQAQNRQNARRQLLQAHRTWVNQQWQASHTHREQIRLRILQRTQSFRNHLVKLQQHRASQQSSSRP